MKFGIAGRRARMGAVSIVGTLAMVTGLGACIDPGPSTPTCAAPTALIDGYPPSTISGPVDGWYKADTRSNGSVRVDATYGAPAGLGCNAAVFTTGASTAAPSQDKAQLANFDLAGTAFSSINTLSYWAYRSHLSAPGSVSTLAFNLAITNLASVVTLNYEPYQQTGGAAAVHTDEWQQWNAISGKWWTTAVPVGTPGSQDDPQPWSWFQTTYGAGWFVAAYGFNIGSSNPNMVVAGDGIKIGPKNVNF